MSKSVWNLSNEELSKAKLTLNIDEWMQLLLMVHARQASAEWMISTSLEDLKYQGKIQLKVQNGKISGYSEIRKPNPNDIKAV